MAKDRWKPGVVVFVLRPGDGEKSPTSGEQRCWNTDLYVAALGRQAEREGCRLTYKVVA